jgi:midasin
VLQCVELLGRVRERVEIELREWPEHAVLNDILIVVDRINNLQSTAPIVRFNTGLQILRQKIDEWNSVAHRLNNLRDLETDIVSYVHRWMKMELQYWRECLTQTLEK